jgi:hypothetical protein
LHQKLISEIKCARLSIVQTQQIGLCKRSICDYCEAAETGSVDLLLEMKKIRGSKKTKHDLPNDVDGVNSELNIVEKFCEVYEQLYISSGSSEALEEIKAQIRDLIEQNGTDQEVMKITGSKVKESACRMKAGKGDVTEGYTSDAILNAPDIRQGSVLSPALFSVYMDDLIVKLRKAGAGCHLGGVFCGVVGYADDLLLLAPSRSAMATMLRICEEYATENNLEFSTEKQEQVHLYARKHEETQACESPAVWG